MEVKRFTARPARAFGGVLAALLFLGAGGLAWPQKRAMRPERGVRFVTDETARRVDALLDGQLFTSYIWPETLTKPVLYPLRTASGLLVTRGFPLEPQAGERADHPHQVGLWFNFGNVNGFDFWNNSSARTPSEKAAMGTIQHRRVTALKDGKTRGELAVECAWLRPDGKQLLREDTRFIFYAGNGKTRALDRLTTLTALDEEVNFADNKEGLLALRVARSLEQATKTPDKYVEADGQTGKVAVVNNEGVTGRYFSSEGKSGDEVFGTRGRWAALTGQIGAETVTLALLDNPKNPNYPAYWFARGYGLFAANPFGSKAYSGERKDAEMAGPSDFLLSPRASVTFRYRLLIISGAATPAELDEQQRRFAAAVK